MINAENFAKRLQEVIDYYNIPASAFADSIGVQRSSISHILSGRNKPSLDFIMKILDTYPEVELYWLLNGKGSFPRDADTDTVNTTPSLFDEQPKPSQKKPDHSEDVQPVVNFKKSGVDRIVIFYKDGTFEEFKKS